LSSRRPASRQPTPTPARAENGTNNGQSNSVVLGPNDRLVGQLYIEGDLRVSGTVEGQLEATGDIEIAGAGKVRGDVTAYNRLTVGGDASLIAQEVRVARLTVEDGATFSGKVSMGKQSASAPKLVVEPEPVVVPEPEPVYAPPEPVQEAVVVEPVKSAPSRKQVPPPKGKRR
jgi:cytoskeletal protein CcmA (bactofilin family)